MRKIWCDCIYLYVQIHSSYDNVLCWPSFNFCDVLTLLFVDLTDGVGDGKVVEGPKSSDNHHGESPFSNSDSVGSFSDKPADFTSAYSQLYQR